MGDGTKQNPYTRIDVIQARDRNNHTSLGLDFSFKNFEDGIDLSDIDLEGASFRRVTLKKAILNGCNLQNTDFTGANLESTVLNGAFLMHANFYMADLHLSNLFGANLENIDLSQSDLVSADLRFSCLKKANLVGCKISSETRLEDINWGNFVLGEEQKEKYKDAESTYRCLKTWYAQSGYSDISAKFYYREKEANRKAKKRWNNQIAGWLSWAVFGYGEGWKRIVFWIIGIVFLFSIIYYSIGTLEPNRFLDSLYYSAVSFVAIGYGGWVEESIGWVRYLGVFETFIGFFMMTLLLTTFVRKWTR